MNFLKNKKQQIPAEQFLDGLNGEDAQRILWMLRLIEHSKENSLPAQFVYEGQEGLTEFRMHTSAGNVWLIAVQAKNGWGIADAGKSKRSRKAPESASRRVLNNLSDLHEGIRLLPVSDVEQYITRRKQRDEEFADHFESGYQSFRMGSLLRQIRDHLGFSQREIADELDQSVSMVSRLENHTQQVGSTEIRNYLECLKGLWRNKK